MKRLVIIALALLVLIGGLYGAMRIRAPKAPPPGTQEIWADQGVPVTVGAVRMGDMEDLVEVTGDINALNRVTLSAKVSGRVAKVFVREGDPVAQGMTVVLLDSEDAGSALEQAQAGLETAKLRLSQATTTAKVTKVQTDTAIEQAKDALSAAESRLAVVKKPTRSQEQMMAENALASAKASLENAEANYKRNDQLLKEGAISQAAFDQARAQFTMAQAEHKSAGDRLQMIKEGGRAEDIKAAETQVNSAREQLRAARANASQYLLRQEDIKQAEAGVRQAKAALALAEQQLSYTAVKSPIAGRLASRLTEPGQVVAPGQSLGEVVDLSSLYFKGEISEKELTKVRKGQQVRVRIDAMPDRAFAGFVKDIYPAGSTTSRNFPVRVVLAGGTAEVRPGMFARGGIVTGYARNVMLVPKDAVEERKGASMVFTIQQKRVTAKGKSRTVDVARRLDIDVVRVNTHSVQVRQPIDLRPGQRVVTQGRQNMQNGVKVSVKNGF